MNTSHHLLLEKPTTPLATITMHYLCVVACDHGADLSRVKNQYGHWVCWMSTSRRTV